MKTWQHYLYKHKLNKHLAKICDENGKIPYENLSSLLTWKMQQQIYYSDITISKIVKQTVKYYISIPVAAFYFNLNYYEKNNKMYNHLTDKPFFIKSKKGMYSYQNKPDDVCCKKHIIDYCKKPKLFNKKWSVLKVLFFFLIKD